jgi:MraZ protein
MLILTPWKGHLRIYPLSEWEIMEDRLMDQVKEQPELRGFIRMVLSGATDCKTDKQGRLLLPVSLRTEIKMKKDVILTGMRDWIEIWDASAWDREMQSTRESFDTLDEGLAKLGIL